MKFLSGIKDYFNRSPNIVKHLDPDNNKFRLFLFFKFNQGSVNPTSITRNRYEQMSISDIIKDMESEYIEYSHCITTLLEDDYVATWKGHRSYSSIKNYIDIFNSKIKDYLYNDPEYSIGHLFHLLEDCDIYRSDITINLLDKRRIDKHQRLLISIDLNKKSILEIIKLCNIQ